MLLFSVIVVSDSRLLTAGWDAVRILERMGKAGCCHQGDDNREELHGFGVETRYLGSKEIFVSFFYLFFLFVLDLKENNLPSLKRTERQEF